LNLLPVGDVSELTGASNVQGSFKLIEAPAVVEKEEAEEVDPAKEYWERRNEQCWRSFIARTEPIERVFGNKLRRVFYEMRKEALEILFKKKKDADDLFVEPFEGYKELVKKYSLPYYEESLKTGYESFVEENGLGIRFDLNDPAVAHYLQLKPNLISGVGMGPDQGVINTLRSQIMDQVREGQLAGESIQQISGRLKGVFNMASRRAQTIARTEVVGGSNFGRNLALKESGFERKEWFTAMDEKVRSEHIAMNGEKIRADESWIVDGHALAYPGDYAGPGYLCINCRCVEVIVPEEGIGEIGREEFSEVTDIDKWSEENFGRLKKELTEDELTAISQYSNYSFGRMNDFLRGLDSTAPEVTQKYIRDLKTAISKGKVPDNIISYRGIHSGIADKFKGKTGLILEDKGFLSTTLSKEKGIFFGRKTENGILLKLYVPKGTNGISFNAVGTWSEEFELILRPDLKFKVLGEKMIEYERFPGSGIEKILEITAEVIDG